MRQKTKPDWTTVGIFDSIADAEITHAALEAAAIPSVIINGTLQSALPITLTWAPVEIKVPDNMLAAAIEIIPQHARITQKD